MIYFIEYTFDYLQVFPIKVLTRQSKVRPGYCGTISFRHISTKSESLKITPIITKINYLTLICLINYNISYIQVNMIIILTRYIRLSFDYCNRIKF